MRALETFALLPLALAFLSACATDRSASVSAPPNAKDYVLVYLKRGPSVAEKSEEERASIQAAHLENIRRLAGEGTLLVAGPFGAVNHDRSVRGIFVFDVATIAEAERLTNTDPAVTEGVLVMEPHRFRTAANLRASLEADLAEEDALKREGRQARIEDRIRSYVLIRADDPTSADAAIARFVPPQAVLIAARVDGRRAFYVLDATDVAAAQAWFAASEDSLGPHTFDEWWSTTTLVQARAN